MKTVSRTLLKGTPDDLFPFATVQCVTTPINLPFLKKVAIIDGKSFYPISILPMSMELLFVKREFW